MPVCVAAAIPIVCWGRHRARGVRLRPCHSAAACTNRTASWSPIFARKNNNNGQKGNSRLAERSKTVVTWVFKMLVFVIFCNSTQQRAGGTRACPGCVAIPYFIRLVPRCSTLFRKVTNARFVVRGPSKGGFMVLPMVNRHVRPKIPGPCTCSTSFSQCRSQHTFARKYVGQQCGNVNCRSWQPYAWSDNVLAVCCGPRNV